MANETQLMAVVKGLRGAEILLQLLRCILFCFFAANKRTIYDQYGKEGLTGSNRGRGT